MSLKRRVEFVRQQKIIGEFNTTTVTDLGEKVDTYATKKTIKIKKSVPFLDINIKDKYNAPTHNKNVRIVSKLIILKVCENPKRKT